MKIRGVTFVERNVDRIFFALVALVFLGVLAMQFIGGGNVVKVDKDADVPIDQAFARVAQRAEAQRGRLQDPAVDPSAEQPVANEAEAFAQEVARGPIAVAALQAPLGPGHERGGESSGVAIDGAIQVALPQIAPPSAPLAHSFAGALDPVFVAQTPDLLSAAPSLARQQPFDIRAVSVEATFDASALVASLREDPDGPGPKQAIPEVWWQSALEILDVQIVRQEARSDGSFGPEELISPPPGLVSLRAQIAGAPEPRTMRAKIAAEARENSRDLVRPRFYRFIAGEPWVPPSVAGQIDAQNAEVIRLKRRHQAVLREIESLKRQLEPKSDSKPPGAKPPSTTQPKEPPRGREGNYGARSGGAGAQAPGGGSHGASSQSAWRSQGIGGGGGGGGRPNRPASQPRSSPAEDDAKRREAIGKQIKALEEQLETLKGQLAGMGVKTDGAASVADPAQQALDEPARRLRDGGVVRLWAHDVTIQPASTYRYRMRLVIPNPLYGAGQSLDESSKSLADSPTLVSDYSPWTQPVAVDPDSYIFITDARRGGAAIAGPAGGVSASAQVFRFYYGFWRTETLQLALGDAVGGDIRIPGAWPIFTIENGPGGKPVSTGSTPGAPSLPATDQAWCLVDVAPMLAGDGKESQAILSDSSGRLTLRDPRKDGASDRLRALRQSAQSAAGAIVLTPDGSAAAAPSSGDDLGEASDPAQPDPDQDGREPARAPASPGGISPG